MNYHPDNCPEGCPCGKITQDDLKEIDELIMKIWGASAVFKEDKLRLKLTLIKGGKYDE